MAKTVLTNARLLFGEYDITSYSNQVTLETDGDMQKATTFSEGWDNFKPGTLKFGASANGYWDDDVGSVIQPDAAMFGSLSASGRVFTVAADGGDENEKCYFFQALTGGYECFGSHGELAPWSLTLAGDSASGGVGVMGTILRNATATGTEDGTALELGAVSDTQTLYGALHITADNFTSCTVKIQSDEASGFASHTDHITFTAASGITYEWGTPVAGANTDTYWRASVSAFVGTSMTYTVVMGIQ